MGAPSPSYRSYHLAEAASGCGIEWDWVERRFRLLQPRLTLGSVRRCSCQVGSGSQLGKGDSADRYLLG
jgi:hypothetical protein